jgi:hypothetical protein
VSNKSRKKTIARALQAKYGVAYMTALRFVDGAWAPEQAAEQWEKYAASNMELALQIKPKEK